MLKNLDRNIGNALVFLAVISYFGLFRFIFVSDTVRIGSKLLAIMLMIVLIILREIYQPEERPKMNYSIPVLLLILGAIPSFFVAQAYYKQDIITSAFASLAIWYYILYFFVHSYQIKIEYITRLIVSIGVLVAALYYIQFFLYPREIMDIVIMRGRGTLRLFVPGMMCTQFAYFYFLNRFFDKNKILDLILAFATLSIFVLQGTRTLILALALLTVINMFFSRTIKGRALKIFVLSLIMLLVFFLFREIFLELTKVSSSQVSSVRDGIRIKAARFFLTEGMPGPWAYVFGNGESALGSSYAERMDYYAHRYGFFRSDIGVLGDYVRFGVVFILAGLVLLVRAIRHRPSPENAFMKYYILMQCFTMVTGKGIFSGVDIILLLILYVFDVEKGKLLTPAELHTDEE